jgi:hypothetical protein
VEAEPKYFISDAFSVYTGLEFTRRPAWLLWQRENLIGSFAGREAQLSAGFDWTIGSRQELRLKLQAVAVTGELNQAYRVVGGNADETAEPVEDFSVANLGFQIRYRYELAPLSYLYVVYGRGGFDERNEANDLLGSVGDTFSLRDDEQLLVKFSYRFEN